MSFNGFTEKTLEYFLSICLDNSKSNFEANRQVYNKHVREPLRALQEALVPVMLEIGSTRISVSSRPAACRGLITTRGFRGAILLKQKEVLLC